METLIKITNKPVSKSILKSMVDAYENRRLRNSEDLPELNPGEKREDTKSAWLSIDAIQNFIAQNPTANGLRIYFAVADNYEVGEHVLKCKPENIKQTTLVFVATSSNNDTPSISNSRNLLIDNKIVSDEDDFFGFGLDDFDICPPPPRNGTCIDIW